MARSFLKLEVAGEWIQGESQVVSEGRADTIECLSFSWGGEMPKEVTAGDPTGRPRQAPVEVDKRIDKATPLLLKAFCEGAAVDRAEFLFFETARDGAEEKFLTVRLKGGRIASMSQVQRDQAISAGDAPPMLEKLSLVYDEIEWHHEKSGASYSSAGEPEND